MYALNPSAPAKDTETVISVGMVLSEIQPWFELYLDTLNTRLNAQFSHYEIILVDNRIPNKGLETLVTQIQHPPGCSIRVLELTKRHRIDIGYTAILENAIGDFVVIANPYTDSVEDVMTMMSEAVSRQYHYTAGYSLDRYWQGFQYSYIVGAYFSLIRLLTGYRFPTHQTALCCFSRHLVNAITSYQGRNRYIKYICQLAGYHPVYYQYHPQHQPGHYRRVGFFERSRFAFDLIVLFSEDLLHWISLFCFGLTFLNLAYLAYVFIVPLFIHEVARGWSSLSIVLSCMFGGLFLALGIIAQYIQFLVNENRKLPIYFIQDLLESHSTIKDQALVNVMTSVSKSSSRNGEPQE